MGEIIASSNLSKIQGKRVEAVLKMYKKKSIKRKTKATIISKLDVN